MRIWRLRSPKIHSQQIGDAGETMVQFQYNSEGLTTRRDEGVIFRPSLSLKAGGDQYSSSKAGRESKFSFTQPFILSGLQRTGLGPLTLGRMICFTQSAYSNVYLIQEHSYRHTQNNV